MKFQPLKIVPELLPKAIFLKKLGRKKDIGNGGKKKISEISCAL